VTELPPVPPDRTQLKAWVDSLTTEQLDAMIIQISRAGTGYGAGYGKAVPRKPGIEVPPPPPVPSLLTITIELCGSEPSIWRQLSLPGDLTLDQVHSLFQAAMGWTNLHLHRFQPGNAHGRNDPHFITRFDESDGQRGTREVDVRLDQLLRTPGDQLSYIYNSGERWIHRVTLESLTRLSANGRRARCLDGARACPHEHIRGIDDHNGLAVWLRAGAPADAVPEPFADAEHARDGLAHGYDPDRFDPAAATTAMAVFSGVERLSWDDLYEPLTTLARDLRGESRAVVAAWLAALDHPLYPLELDDDEVSRVVQPWRALLDAIGTGTKLTPAGFLPPAVVEAIAKSSGVGQRWLGRGSRESQAWPVAALRQSALDQRLIRKAKGTLTTTAQARSLARQPRKLLSTLMGQLPQGRPLEVEAGWFALLGTAAGYTDATLDTAVAQVLTGRGWRTDGVVGVSPAFAHKAMEPTMATLALMSGDPMEPDHARWAQMAYVRLFGFTAPF
jgi:hypothetical protein